ncbi:MAG TPA: hypothetical protein ENO24_10140 [Chloroflexi bacterium]|nr:hypothetical protein [Chloroflexota bacterium]
MDAERVVLIAGAAVTLVGLAMLGSRRVRGQDSFYRSEIWLPHHVEGARKLPLSWQGPIAGDRVSLDEASRRMPFPIPLPSYVPEEARLREVYVSRMDDPPLYRQAALVHENGVYIILRYGGMTWSWESPFRARPEGFELVEVSGHGGVGADPLPGRPGVVEWQVGPLVAAVYSYDHSLTELLRVAESMDLG